MTSGSVMPGSSSKLVWLVLRWLVRGEDVILRSLTTCCLTCAVRPFLASARRLSGIQSEPCILFRRAGSFKTWKEAVRQLSGLLFSALEQRLRTGRITGSLLFTVLLGWLWKLVICGRTLRSYWQVYIWLAGGPDSDAIYCSWHYPGL